MADRQLWSPAGNADMNSPAARLPLSVMREHFRKYDTDKDGWISVEELVGVWASVAEDNLNRMLDVGERKLFAAGVERFFAEVDVDGDGRISVDEWLHAALLDAQSPGPMSVARIAARAHQLDVLVSNYVKDWELVDPGGTGAISRDVVKSFLVAYSMDEKRSGLASDLLDVMNMSGDDCVTYAEFCAFRLNLSFVPVTLYYYDLSKSFAKYLAPLLVWHKEEGIWHTSIVVHETEIYYLGLISRSTPGKSPFGDPTKSLRLGCTLCGRQELAMKLEEIDVDFQPELYDVLDHNCNDLSDRLSLFLLGRRIPNSVRLLPDRLMDAPVAKVLRPVLNRILSQQADETVEDDLVQKVDDDRTLLRDPDKVDASHVGKLVLYEKPDCPEPVVACLQEIHDDGTSKLSWFDSEGHCRTADGVRTKDLRQYSVCDSEIGPKPKGIYAAALRALDEARSQMLEAVPTLSKASIQASFEGGEIKDMRKCANGHLLVTKKLGFRQGHVHARHCNICGNYIDRHQERLRCDDCDYDVCFVCWEMRRGPESVQQNPVHRLGRDHESPHMSARSCSRAAGWSDADAEFGMRRLRIAGTWRDGSILPRLPALWLQRLPRVRQAFCGLGPLTGPSPHVPDRHGSG